MKKKRVPLVVLVEKEQHNPFEVWLLIALFISGTLYLIGVSQPQSVHSFTNISRMIWNFQVATGSLVALCGMLWKPHTLGRSLRVAGLVWAGTGAFLYSCVTFYYNGTPALIAATIFSGLAFAAWFRAYQLRKQIKLMVKKVEAQHEANSNTNLLDGGDDS